MTPFSAEKIFFSEIKCLIFFNSSSTKGEGIAKIKTSDLFTTSIIDELGFILDIFKFIDLKYFGFFPFSLIEETFSSLLTYQFITSLFSDNIFTIAVPQLPPPSTPYLKFIL